MSAYNDMMEEMILAGAVEVAGLDEDGQFLYSFTPKVAELYPQLVQQIESGIYSHLMKLWEKGFLDIDITSESPMVNLTDKSQDLEALETLSEHERLIMTNIVNYFNEE